MLNEALCCFQLSRLIHAETITRAASAASTVEVEYVPWTAQDGSGSPVDRAVDGWLDDAEALVADITYVNDNVTYEIGYAIGAGKDLRLIRNSSVELSRPETDWASRHAHPG